MKDASLLPVALFDSGVGGLTVLKALADRLPGEDLLYLGDTAGCLTAPKAGRPSPAIPCWPPGSWWTEARRMLVVACNTATAAALPALREHFAPLPVVGVVEPGARAAARTSRQRRNRGHRHRGYHYRRRIPAGYHTHPARSPCAGPGLHPVRAHGRGRLDGRPLGGGYCPALSGGYVHPGGHRAAPGHPAVGLHAFSASAGGPAKRGGPRRCALWIQRPPQPRAWRKN